MLSYILFAVLSSGVRSQDLIGLVAPDNFHTQDVYGQYAYGYNGGPSAKIESKTLDGITRGGYSYIDANGIVQSVSYVADPINGFRVAATNLPQAPQPDIFQGKKISAAIPIIKLGEIIKDVKLLHEIKNKEPAQTLNPIPDVNTEGLKSAEITPVAFPPPQFKPFDFPPYVFKPSESKLQEYKQENAAAVKFNQDYKPETEKNIPVPGIRAPEPFKLASVKGFLPQGQSSVLQSVPPFKIALPNFSVSPVAYTNIYYPSLFLNHDASLLLTGRLSKNLNRDSSTLQKEESPQSRMSENIEDVAVESKSDEVKERTKRSAIIVPILPTTGQYEIKDGLGNFAYGYQNPLSSKVESRNLNGQTNGAYSYVDANGVLQSVHYTADRDGFRVAGTNLP